MAKQASEASYRYERKFVVAAASTVELELLVKLCPGCFSEVHHPRYVNNIYFDSASMECFSPER